MFKMMFSLQWKEFNRGKAVGGKLLAKILKWFGIIYVAVMAFLMGIIASAYGGPLAEFPLEEGTTASFFVRQQAVDLRISSFLIVLRYFVQATPSCEHQEHFC